MSIVYLVGSGPGDPGLITVRGRELLAKADVVVYDYLAPKQLLSVCRADAELIYVGKKGGDHTLPQGGINQLLVDKAGEGHKVIVRLKGGDPYIFGRGGEEAQELVQAGVAFEVVPGVTSAVAGGAYAGIPLTHRDHASSVCLITGHEGEHKSESVFDWEALARSASTLVFYMGVKNLPNITRQLMEHGMSEDTPAALVRWGTTCRHKSLVSTVGNIAAQAKALNWQPPSLIIVGSVCSLKPELEWFEKRPLLGKGVVVTRARQQSSGLLADLTELGACAYEFPAIEIVPMEDEKPIEAAAQKLDSYDWVIFTSVNGVKYFFGKLYEAGKDARAFGGLQVAAIGPATAKTLEDHGIRPDFVPDKYVAEHVVEGLLARGVAGTSVLLPRAEVAREVLPEKLAEAGARVDVLPVYRTIPGDVDSGKDADIVRQALQDGDIQYITFTSSSTVENFFARIPAEELKKYPDVLLACIGPITANTLEGFGFAPHIQPDDFTIPALVDALVAHATKQGG